MWLTESQADTVSGVIQAAGNTVRDWVLGVGEASYHVSCISLSKLPQQSATDWVTLAIKTYCLTVGDLKPKVRVSAGWS